MDRKGRTVFRGLLPFLFIAACVSVATGSRARAVEPATRAPATELADGIWTVHGHAIHGTRRCGDWLVRLTNARGQLSGVVSHARTTVPMENLVLMPDGSFSGTTRAGLAGSRFARASKITGRFSEDSVSLTFNSELCPPRHGVATRHAAGG
jgi:hypothetical protein